MLRSRYRRALVALAAALLVLPGCASRAAVEGTVTLDGAPVDGGTITFIPSGSDSKRVMVSADIVNGKYTLPAGKGPVPGTYRVEIIWNKKTGRQIETPGDTGVKMDETVPAIPAQFNTNSKLSAEVKSGANTKDFDLKSR
jgi:hypothetical protein